jgi:glucose-1-phosphate cytidylyltransferase
VKVVLFCGGLGLRMGETSKLIPKPMIRIGDDKPILWHIMSYYSSFGFNDFILCLGYKAEVIKEYFLTYSEALANDFVLADGGKRIDLLHTDTHDWSMTFVNTGLKASVGQRLKAVEPYLGDDELFLANYGDTLTDAPLLEMIELLKSRDKTALFLCARPTYSFHLVDFGPDGAVTGLTDVTKADVWLNGGYFVCRRELLDRIEPGEDLVDEPFRRLIAEEQLIGYRYDGFWAPMDTLKDKTNLDAMLEAGEAPWRAPRGATTPEA